MRDEVARVGKERVCRAEVTICLRASKSFEIIVLDVCYFARPFSDCQ
jgi:hypothetical protein